ncbi:TPA: hypothetical protein ACH3X2_004849 [Trebouxia sp. C0005]
MAVGSKAVTYGSVVGWALSAATPDWAGDNPTSALIAHFVRLHAERAALPDVSGCFRTNDVRMCSQLFSVCKVATLPVQTACTVHMPRLRSGAACNPMPIF